MTSALVPRATATAFLAAAQTCSNPNDYFFRFDEQQETANEDEDMASKGGAPEPTSKVRFHGQFKPRRWISDQGESYGIDEYDPWGDIAKLTLFGDKVSTLIGEEPPIESWQATAAANPS